MIKAGFDDGRCQFPRKKSGREMPGGYYLSRECQAGDECSGIRFGAATWKTLSVATQLRLGNIRATRKQASASSTLYIRKSQYRDTFRRAIKGSLNIRIQKEQCRSDSHGKPPLYLQLRFHHFTQDCHNLVKIGILTGDLRLADDRSHFSLAFGCFQLRQIWWACLNVSRCRQ